MNIIHVAYDPCRFRRKSRPLHATQKASFDEAAVNIRHPGFDILPELKLTFAHGNLHGTNLPRPFIHILEKVTADCLQVSKIEIAVWDAFQDALSHELAFALSNSRASRMPSRFRKTDVPE